MDRNTEIELVPLILPLLKKHIRLCWYHRPFHLTHQYQIKEKRKTREDRKKKKLKLHNGKYQSYMEASCTYHLTTTMKSHTK